MKDYTRLTLGQLISNKSQTIRRNAVSILKILQRKRDDIFYQCTECGHEYDPSHADIRCTNCGEHQNPHI